MRSPDEVAAGCATRHPSYPAWSYGEDYYHGPWRKPTRSTSLALGSGRPYDHAEAARTAAAAQGGHQAAADSPTRRSPSKRPPRSNISFCYAVCELLSLNAATALVSSKQSLQQPYENICLVSSLLLTMVTLSPVDNVGEELTFEGDASDGALTARYFTLLAFLTTALLFTSMLLGALIVLLCGVLRSDAEAVAWAAQCPLIFRLNLFTFFSGLLLYLSSVSYQLVSWLGVDGAVLPCLAAGWALVALTLLSLVQSVRFMYMLHEERPPVTPGASAALEAVRRDRELM